MSIECSVYITHKCNLRCSFCYFAAKLTNRDLVPSDKQLDQTIKYISEDNYEVYFVTNNQRFCITPYGCDSIESAEWFEEMFEVAPMELLKKESEV